MAQRITLVDDMDGSERGNVQTRTIILDDIKHEIDLNDVHYKEMIQAIAPWLDKARVAGGVKEEQQPLAARVPRTKTQSKKKTADTAKNAMIREWANRNGHNVGAAGRLPNAVITAYNDAQPAGGNLVSIGNGYMPPPS